MRALMLTPLGVVLNATLVSAQSLNVDVGDPTIAIPAPAYAAAAGQAGQWCPVPGNPGTYPLTDLSGAPTPATLTLGLSLSDYYYDNPGTTGDDQALLDDCTDVVGDESFTFNGLLPGDYVVYTYAWAVDSDLDHVDVGVVGSPDPVQTVGGAWPGGHVHGVTYALHNVTVDASMMLQVDLTMYMSELMTLNGFQLVYAGTSLYFCLGDGSDGASCPCGNSAVVGSPDGCVNSTGVGAHLSRAGVASVTADSLILSVHQATANEFGIFVQNITVFSGAPFFDGAVCLPGDAHLVRHYAPPGVLPTLTDLTGYGMNAQGMVAGDYLGDTVPGRRIHYQFWYRDNTGPCGVGANFSSGLSVDWIF